ncbi:site-specific integrase [Pseudomonas sp.]|uniref:site-specific integrase n=1 Tax=Pseudomonas sp. TaxID=306 RepID=UPI0028A8E63E|nr:site-specific integrase [Pseudomonas sp.]
MANNLELQGGTWHVRLAIPADVRKAFGGRRILSRSLETGQRSEAMNLRLPYLAQWKAQIADARAKATAQKENWRPQIAAQGYLLDQNIAARFLAASKRTPKTQEDDPETVDAQAQLIAESLLRIFEDMARWQEYGVEGIPQLLQELDILSPCSPIELAQKTAKFKRELTARVATAHYGLTPTEATEAQTIVVNPTSYKPKSPITKPRLAAFRAAREGLKISDKNVDQQESKLQKLSAFLGDNGNPLDFDVIAAWLDSLNVSAKTKAQYINAGTTFWKWAMKYDAQWREDFKGAVNPFENHDLPFLRGKAKADAQRADFSLTELAKLHSAASTEGNNTLADLILLGTYTGARIEELCQLRTEDVIKVDGVQSFDITASKTVAGIRVLPVHPALTSVVQRLIADSRDGYLVPSASRNKYGNRSDLHSKAFGRLKKSLGFDKDHVFHSIRMTAITQLVRAEVSGPLIAELVGHETGTVTFDTYSQGASAAQKLVAISKIHVLPAP